MQLKTVIKITGTIEVVTGLHIGAGSEEMHIGGTDNPVVKNPLNRIPYIPGSSIKGKMRSLLEWYAGLVGITGGKPISFDDLKNANDEQRNSAITILQLFGGLSGNSDENTSEVQNIGPSRLAFWDCPLDDGWAIEMQKRNIPTTEIKMENSINRIKGVADNPRSTERVPAGARFQFNLSMRMHDGDDDQLFKEVLRGLKLVELTGLGGSGSRGYGKVRFTNLMKDKLCVQDEFDEISISE